VRRIRFHLLTAVIRPELLPAVAKSVAQAASAVLDRDSVEVHWHVRRGVESDRGGYRTKNALLEEVPSTADDWVIVLDDDNTLHPQLLVRLVEVIEDDTEAVIVSCESALHGVLRAAAENVKVGSIDAAQAVLRRDRFGELRWPHRYTGDGRLLQLLVPELGSVIYLDEPLAYHNRLRPSTDPEPKPAAV